MHSGSRLATVASVHSVQSNILAIVILCLGRCGLSKCISRYLVAMTVADLMAVITTVIFVRIVYRDFPNSFVTITHVCRLISFLDCTTRAMSVWLTVAFTFDRYVAICCPKLKTKYCTEKTALRVIAVLALIFFVENIPWYFSYVPQYTVNDIPRGCQHKSSYHTSLSWIVFDWLHVILTPFLPFVLILLLNAQTVSHILESSRARRRLRGHSDGDRNRGGSDSDPEMRKRKKSIILLFAVSANFILLWITFVLFFLYWRFSKKYYYTGYSDPSFIIWRVAFMLVYLSCCTNTYIYAVTQTKFRVEIRKAVTFPFILITWGLSAYSSSHFPPQIKQWFRRFPDSLSNDSPSTTGKLINSFILCFNYLVKYKHINE
uniref:G-protein coupled receptors family 1 profile domain-containing protein n=1 Tax=Callorhinchus milii TaxID=7868 RepID=A0A4W3GL80_CALMI